MRGGQDRSPKAGRGTSRDQQNRGTPRGSRVHRNAVVSLSDRTEDPVHHQGQAELHGGNRRERKTSNRTPTEVALTEKSCEPPSYPLGAFPLRFDRKEKRRQGANDRGLKLQIRGS